MKGKRSILAAIVTSLLIGLPAVAATSPSAHEAGRLGQAMEMAGLPAAAGSYTVQYLDSNGMVPANATDPVLVNAWGLAASPDGPWWIADNGTGDSSLFDGTGTALALVVNVPGSPTGIVYNQGPGFVITSGTASGPARFLFATEEGTILGWNPIIAPPAPAVQSFVAVDSSASGAVYKGLALVSGPEGDRIFATDFHNGRVDVFDGTFTQVLRPGAFVDPEIPAGFAPFGIRAVGSRVFVTYARQTPGSADETAGQGLGFVTVYDADGNFLARVATRGRLNAPWGLALAPADFGRAGGDLLVGNFGDGRILAFHPNEDMTSFTPEGSLTDSSHKPIVINGLWGISFGNGAAAGPTNALYFAAGPDDESAGLFGRIDPQ